MEKATTNHLPDDLREHFNALPNDMCEVHENKNRITIWCSEEYIGKAIMNLDKYRNAPAVQFDVRSYGSPCIVLIKVEDEEEE